jgi:hypothetical protein
MEIGSALNVEITIPEILMTATTNGATQRR